MGVLNSTLWGEDEIPSLLSPSTIHFYSTKPWGWRSIYLYAHFHNKNKINKK